MKHVMFDIDGTLVKSFEFDERLYIDAVEKITRLAFDPRWEDYPHITDSGILMHFLESQGQSQNYLKWHSRVKQQFISTVAEHTDTNPVEEISGARAFFHSLKNNAQVKISLATGGWGETARLKLASAKFDVAGIRLASSNDHHVRTRIMQHALGSSPSTSGTTATETYYFGDGEWDKAACEQLGINFIAVGERVSNSSQIDDFNDIEAVYDILELTQQS